MNEPIQDKAPETAWSASEARAVVADPGTRRADDRDNVADGWQEAADLRKGKCTRGAAAITGRSKRDEDCRSSESNPRAPARAARCAECPSAAEPVPGAATPDQQQAQTSYAPRNAAANALKIPSRLSAGSASTSRYLLQISP